MDNLGILLSHKSGVAGTFPVRKTKCERPCLGRAESCAGAIHLIASHAIRFVTGTVGANLKVSR